MSRTAEPRSAPLDRDHIAAFAAEEGAVVIGREVRVYAETSSTNDRVLEMGRAGTPEGVAVFAERQSRGRGTRGRAWESRPGLGVWFSVLLRPGGSLPVRDWPRLTPMAAVGVAAALEEITGETTHIKWPNDLYLRGRKLCGILTETQAQTRPPDAEAVPSPSGFAVLGIGLNVNHTPADWPEELREIAVSLAVATGYPLDRNIVAGTLLRRLDRAYRKLGDAEEFSRLIGFLRERDFLRGRKIEISEAETELRRGTAEGFGEQGELLLRGPEGLVHKVISGTVTVLG